MNRISGLILLSYYEAELRFSLKMNILNILYFFAKSQSRFDAPSTLHPGRPLYSPTRKIDPGRRGISPAVLIINILKDIVTLEVLLQIEDFQTSS
jgi:hypothetical protein